MIFHVVSGHWSNGNCTQFLRRVFQVKELPLYSQEALPSRMNPILGRILLPLLLLALRRWLSLPSSDFSIQFGFVKVFLADHVNACSGIYHKLSFRGFYCGCGRQYPLVGRRIECSFVFLFELKDFLGKCPRISACTSLLSCSLFWRSVLKKNMA